MGVSNPKLANFIQFVSYSFCNKVKPLTLYQEQHGMTYITHFEYFAFTAVDSPLAHLIYFPTEGPNRGDSKQWLAVLQ
jgi:hypothetical protein